MPDYFIGIDVGTTAVKGALLDDSRQIRALARREQRQYFPRPGWVEQDPEDLFTCVLTVLKKLLREGNIPAQQVRALGLDHQGESCLVWNRRTGETVYPVITWQDCRCAVQAHSLEQIYGEQIQNVTGAPANAYYSAFKIRWILDHIPDGQIRAERGELAAGTLNTYLIWRLTGGQVFRTDTGSACCTLLFDPREKDWNPWLLGLFRLPRVMLPEIYPCDGDFGMMDGTLLDGVRIPITGSIPDSNAGMIGAGALEPGGFTVSYGTGNFLHLSVGGTYVPPRQGLTASCLFDFNGRRGYQLNGVCYTAGAAVKWLQNGLGILDSDMASAEAARSVPDSGGVLFVPALTGLAMPYWDQDARGAFLGLTAGTTRAHLIRAVLESVALQVANSFAVFQMVAPRQADRLLAIGGMTENDFLMQYQADLIGVPVELPRATEPAYGAARLSLASLLKEEPLLCDEGPRRIYTPRRGDRWRDRQLSQWRQGVDRCLVSPSGR